MDCQTSRKRYSHSDLGREMISASASSKRVYTRRRINGDTHAVNQNSMMKVQRHASISRHKRKSKSSSQEGHGSNDPSGRSERSRNVVISPIQIFI